MHYNRMSSLVNETLPKRNHRLVPGRSNPLAAVIPKQEHQQEAGRPHSKKPPFKRPQLTSPTCTHTDLRTWTFHDFNVFSFFTAININWQCSYTTAQTIFQALADNCKQ